MAEIKQLIRETNPPAGSPRIPVPQIYDDVQEGPSTVRGRHGIPGAVLYGPDGNPLSQVATESTLAEAVSRLNAILTRLEGTLDVDVGGQIHADVDLGDVTVQIGEVQQGKRGPNSQPWEVQLTGQIEVLYEGSVSTITAGSSVTLVAKRPTEFKEVRGGIAVSSATRGDWRLYVSHLHASGGNNFGSEDLVRLTDNDIGGSGAKNLLSSHFEVRVSNNNSFDAGVYRASILGVR